MEIEPEEKRGEVRAGGEYDMDGEDDSAAIATGDRGDA
jgi:hypothetical protein